LRGNDSVLSEKQVIRRWDLDSTGNITAQKAYNRPGVVSLGDDAPFMTGFTAHGFGNNLKINDPTGTTTLYSREILADKSLKISDYRGIDVYDPATGKESSARTAIYKDGKLLRAKGTQKKIETDNNL